LHSWERLLRLETSFLNPAVYASFAGAAKGKGKSGGVRVIYYFHSEAFPLFLLTVYAKNQKANLTKAERNDLKTLVPLLVKSYPKGRRK
jgi:hypothetical protein